MAFPVHYFHDDATDAEIRFASDDNGLLEGGSDLPHFSEERLFPLRLPTIREPSKTHIAKGRRERAQAVQADFVFKRAKQDCYTPYQDYLGLCHELEYGEGCGRSELSPSSDISLSSDDTSDSASLGLVRFAVGTSRFDQLDRERLAAMSEFARNGTTFDLDDYDIIQQKVRGHEPPTREIPVVPNDRLKEFLWHKQSKIAANSVPDALTSQFKKKSKLICVFCKNNKEPQHVYTGHVLKDWRGYTVCPVLRKYPCPICQAIGDHAHTIKYCPFNNDSEFRTSPSPLRTSRMATGKKRRT